MTDEPAVTVVISEYTVCAVPANQPSVHGFKVHVAHMWDGLWEVTQGVRRFAVDGSMSYGATSDELASPEWQAVHYMPLGVALKLAVRLAPTVKVGRMTVAEVCAGAI